MSESLGFFEGSRSSDSFFFYSVATPHSPPPSITVIEYNPPVAWGLDEWYIFQGHSATHSGLDINMAKWPRGDVDLGEPVFATCNGLVVYAQQAPGRYWGNLVITMSQDDNGFLFWRYAHLQQVAVEAGWFVDVSQKVGTIGKGYADRYDAHLHLDVCQGWLPTAGAWLSRVVRWLDPLEVWRAAGEVWEWGTP